VQGGSAANTNYGTASKLVTKAYRTVSYERDFYLRFDFSNVQTISNAKLRLFGSLSGDENANVPVGLFTAGKAAWGENSITFNNRPVVGSLLAQALVSTSTTQQWYEFDLTEYLKALKAKGVNAVTLVMKNLQSSATTSLFNSREANANQPQLVITS
jgi:hypothetical protein